jgi:hypothetical protein
MEVRVRLNGSPPGALESLDDWLQGDTRFNGRVRMRGPQPRDGEMGALTDVLVVALGSGGTLSVLATSLHAWLSQPRRSNIRVRVEGADGQVVEIGADRVTAQQAEALLDRAFGSGAAGE